METSKLTAEGIIGEAVRIGAKMSGSEFPIEIFPIRIQRIISSLHDCQGYPVDYVAAAILAAIAVGIGNSHLVQVKRNWQESPILYMALIGRPGANKSHPLSFAFQPFIEHDYCQHQEYQKLYAEYERAMSMSKKERMEAGLDEFPQAPMRRTLSCFGYYSRRIEPDTCPKSQRTLPLVGRAVGLVQELQPLQ